MASRPSASVWADDPSDDSDTDTSRLIDGRVSTYQSTEKQAIRNHEAGLEKLGEAIKRQKYMANEIATEVDLHIEILDNIDTGVTNTSENLRKNTKNVNLLMKKSSTCLLWFIIFVLALVILGLAIL